MDVAWADSGTTALWAGYLSGAPGNVHHPNFYVRAVNGSRPDATPATITF
jgi:hypothetical protein